MSRIALVQTTSTEDFEQNLDYALKQVKVAAEKGAEVVAFPEVFLFIGGRKKKLEIAQPIEGEIVTRFREAARENRIAILMGSFHESIPERDDKVFNTALWIDAEGEIRATYRKRRLFDIELPEVTIKESDTIVAGEEPSPVFETPIGRVGLTICFDLRYPDLFQDLRRNGAEVIFVPSNFTAQTGAAHWELLLRSRAIENQVFIAAPAQYGRHNPKFISYGHSLLVDPWGTVSARASEGNGILMGEIDLDYLRKVRRELPMGVD